MSCTLRSCAVSVTAPRRAEPTLGENWVPLLRHPPGKTWETASVEAAGLSAAPQGRPESAPRPGPSRRRQAGLAAKDRDLRQRQEGSQPRSAAASARPDGDHWEAGGCSWPAPTGGFPAGPCSGTFRVEESHSLGPEPCFT